MGNTEQNRAYYEKNKDKIIAEHKEYRAKNKDKVKDYNRRYSVKNADVKRNSELKYKYGITLEEYNELLARQNNVCAVCKFPCSTGRRLAVDHCHATGKVRGLLCSDCNTAIGKFKDSPDLLLQARQYLEQA